MTPSEAALLLGKLAATDGRTISEATARAWAETLPDVALDEALAAVPIHFRQTTDFAMPAHILRIVADMRREQRRAERERQELEAEQQAAIGRGPVDDRSEDVTAMVHDLRDRLPSTDATVFRRPEWVEQEKREARARRRASAEPNPLFRGFPPPGGFPVPDESEAG